MITWRCIPHPDKTCSLEAVWRQATFRMHALSTPAAVIDAIARVNWYVQEMQP